MRRSLSPLLVAALTLLSACQPHEDPFPSDFEFQNFILPLGRLSKTGLPADPTNAYADSAAAAALGRALFSDPQFSSCGTVSCSTCHDPNHGFAGNNPMETGCARGPGPSGSGPRNAPTILNAAFNLWYTWDGHKDTLWAHATQPLTLDFEMGAMAASVRARLQSNYATQYNAIYGNQPSTELDDDRILANFGKAIEAYERTLIKVKSPFDAQLSTFIDQYNAKQDVTNHPIYLQLKTFVRTGFCVQCHGGANFNTPPAGTSFKNIGVNDGLIPENHGREYGIQQLWDANTHQFLDRFNGMSEYSDDRSPTNSVNSKLNSLPAEAADPSNLGAYRIPTLRNVALTGPYFHNGERDTLAKVVDFYNQGGDPNGSFAGQRVNTGDITQLNLTDAEKTALVDLLNSLTGTETLP